MSTPITDAQIEELSADKYSDLDAYMTMSKHARRLELDRAALMEALDGVMKHYRNIAGDCDDRDQAGEEIASLQQAESALAAARANFPES